MQWVWVLLALTLGMACGDDGEPPRRASVEPGDASTGMRECIDEDGDGFGNQWCTAGRDCDDDDPEVTDECHRCRSPSVSCPCDPGTEPVFCDPPDIQVEGGVLTCSEGTRYCRDGLWSDCEIIGEYTFVPTGQ